MQTNQLEQELRTLDERASQLAGVLKQSQRQIDNFRAQASSFRSQAAALIAQASGADDDDSGRASAMISQAQSLYAQADSLDYQADNLESEVSSIQSELNSCCSSYEQYRSLGQTNISNLRTTAAALSGAGGSYGGSKISETLNAVNKRLAYNQKLVDGCDKRIQWIRGL